MSTPTRRPWLPRSAVLWLLGLAMVGVLAVVVYTWNAFRAAATRQLLERDGEVTTLSAFRLQQSLADYAGTLTQVTRSREMSEGGIAVQTQALRAAAARLTVFDGGVVLLDGRGLVRAVLPERPVLIARNWSGRDFYQSVLSGQEMAVSDAQQLFPGDPYVVVVAVPIRGEGDALVGMLAGIFNLDEPTLSSFYANIVRLRLGQSGATFVADGKGRILFDSESKRVGRFLSLDQLTAPPGRGAASAILTQSEDGQTVISASAPVPGTTWTLTVQDDWSAVTRETARYRNLLVAAFLAMLFLPPLALALLARQRRFPVLEPRRPDRDAGWVTAVRDHARPTSLPTLPGWAIFARQVAGKSADTDFYDIRLQPDGRLSLCLGRLRGGGMQGGLALASFRAALASAGQRLLPAEESLKECNAVLAAQHEAAHAIACLCLIVDPLTGVVDYAAAGTSPLRQNLGRLRQEGSAVGHPLGSAADPAIESGELRLEPRGLLLLLGPSMLDARDADGHGFAGATLDAALARPYSSQPELVDRIMEAFKAFQEKSPLFAPDRTVVVLEHAAE